MARYRKLPVEIEAHQWWKNGDHPDDGVLDRDTEGKIVRYFRRPEPEYAGTKVHDKCGRTWHDHGWIDTLEGGHAVCPGDWIITGVHDERYPCKPDIFAATYEPGTDQRPPAAALIEIVERNRCTDDSMTGSVIVPDEIRINGIPLLVPDGQSIRVHEMVFGKTSTGERLEDACLVTLTLFARRIVVTAEEDLQA